MPSNIHRINPQRNLPRTNQATPSLNTSIPACIDYYINCKAQYYKTYLNSGKYRLATIAKHFAPYTLADLTVNEDAREFIQSFIDMRLRKVKDSTARKDACALQSMLNWYRRDIGLPIPDIFKRIRVPSDNRIREFIPNDTQVNDCIAELPNSELRSICILLSETACRRNEILHLRVSDVHIHERYIQLYNTKNGTDRKVPLSFTAIAILSKVKEDLGELKGVEDNRLLFTAMPEYVSKSFRKACNRVEQVTGQDLSGFVLHSLRHYRLSKLIQAGHDSLLVSKVSGHKDPKTLSRYVKLDASALAETLFD